MMGEEAMIDDQAKEHVARKEQVENDPLSDQVHPNFRWNIIPPEDMKDDNGNRITMDQYMELQADKDMHGDYAHFNDGGGFWIPILRLTDEEHELYLDELRPFAKQLRAKYLAVAPGVIPKRASRRRGSKEDRTTR